MRKDFHEKTKKFNQLQRELTSLRLQFKQKSKFGQNQQSNNNNNNNKQIQQKLSLSNDKNGLFGYDETDDFKSISKRDRKNKPSLFEDGEIESLTNERENNNNYNNNLNEKKNRITMRNGIVGSNNGVNIEDIEEQEFNKNLFYLPSQDEMSGNENEKNKQFKLEVSILHYLL